jgi:Ca-activated chloride channel family protein
MKRKLIRIGVCLLMFAAILVSQNAQNTAIVGTVMNQAGALIANASVELQQNNATVAKTTTDKLGKYAFQKLAAGPYGLTVSAPGFKRHIRSGIVVAAGRTVRVDVVLEAGPMSESVTVSQVQQGQQGSGKGKGGAAGVPQPRPAPPPPPPPSAPREMVSADKSTGLGVVAGGMGMAVGGPAFARNGIYQQERYSGPGFRGRIPTNEEYGHYVENEFSSPTKDPLSTFAVDVDTASYSNIRRFLNDGQMPPPESVRIEELVNYFRYDYPLPESGKPVALATHVFKNPWNKNTLLMHVGLRTQPIAAEDLPSSHLTFLIDVSGSMMTPDKLPLVKSALQMLVRQLRPQDTVALVVYAGAAGTVLPPTRGDRQQQILDAIGKLEAGGSTNGAGGIRLAYQQARQSFSKSSNNRVILATDGDFNVGVSSDDELVKLIEQERQSGVFLSVLGFGTGNLKDAKMEMLADHGNGTYAYIDSLAEARKVFVQEMGASLVTVAKDVKLQIEFNPAYVKEYRLVGYENRLLRPEDFNDDQKDAGDLGAGHQVTAFYEITPANGVGSGDIDALRYQTPEKKPARNGRSGEFAWVKLRYKAPQGDRSALLEWPVGTGQSGAMIEEFRAIPRDVRFAAAVAEYGLLLRHSKFAGDSNYQHVLAVASESVGADLAGYRTDFLDLVRRAETIGGKRASR